MSRYLKSYLHQLDKAPTEFLVEAWKHLMTYQCLDVTFEDFLGWLTEPVKDKTNFLTEEL